MNIDERKLYNKAKKRVLKAEALKEMTTKPNLTLEEAEKNFKSKLEEISTRMLNGEFEEQIQREIEVIKQEQKQKEER